jgi:trehalose 6-phosphate synthase
LQAVSDAAEIVIASNRGPVSFVATDDGFKLKRGAGGLAGAMDPVARRLGDGAVWIAATTSEEDRAALAAGEGEFLAQRVGYPVRLLDIGPSTYTRYYDVVSNGMLWFANHCLWDEIGAPSIGESERDAWRSGYEVVNRRFARAALESARPDGLVLFQDYHLARAPALLSRDKKRRAVAHFTHSSFCARGMEALPDEIARGVVEGMLGADLVGFHVTPWADEFLECCERMGFSVDRNVRAVEHAGRRAWVRCYGIPIDTESLRERAQKNEVLRWARKFAAESRGPLVVRVDRTEPSKNIVRGFEAFGRVLDRRPDLRGARFVACIYPSRQSMAEYRRYAAEIEASVRSVNERHRGSILLSLEDDYDRSLGALLAYDVLLVNPLMDGMNLVSKEGAALNERDGALVLSGSAGSFSELGAHAQCIEAPRDVDATVAALEAAIDLSAGERAVRARALRAAVERRSPVQWIEAQIEDLSAIRDGAGPKR